MVVSEKKLALTCLCSFLLIQFLLVFRPPLIDDGLEFVSVSMIFGIAHPSGYPLYTLLGAVWLRLTFFLTPYLSMSLMNFLLSMAALCLLYRILRRRFSALPSVAFVALLFSNSQFILISIRPEVYSLHLLFLVLFISVLDSPLPFRRKLFLLFILQGLSLTNHLTAVFFLFLWVPWLIQTRKEYTPGLVFKAAFLGLCPLLLYLYMPLASVFKPSINWGNPSTWEGFWWLVTGGDYGKTYLLRPFIGTPLYPDYPATLVAHITRLLKDMISNIPFLFLIFFLFFSRVPLQQWRKKFGNPFSTGLLLYLTVLLLFMSHYAIPDINEHLPLLYTALFFWIVLFLPRDIVFTEKFLLILALGIVLTFFLASKKVPVERDYNIIEESVIKLPKNSIVITQGDDIYAFWYIKHARQIRQDITYVGANFINYPWYETFFENQAENAEIKSFEGWEIEGRQWVQRVIDGILEPNQHRKIFLFFLFPPDPVLIKHVETIKHQVEEHHFPFYEVTGWEYP